VGCTSQRTNVSHELIPLADRARWEAAVARVPHALGHTWEYCDALARTSGLPTYLAVVRSDGGTLACPVAEREHDGAIDAVTPYGFSGFTGIGDGEALRQGWETLAKDREWVAAYIGLHPALTPPRSILEGAPTFEHNLLFVLDLERDDDALWRGLSANRRRALRHWSPDDVRTDAAALGRFLADEYEGFFARKGAGSATDLAPATLECLVRMPGTFLVGAPADGPLESVAMFGLADGIGEYLFNVSTPGGERHGVTLVWAGVQHLRAAGARVLHLGGGVRPGDDIAEFKRRFGASTMPLRSIRQVFQAERYAALCAAAGVDAADRAGYFPAYRSGRASVR
jgi:hypothetical protein